MAWVSILPSERRRRGETQRAMAVRVGSVRLPSPASPLLLPLSSPPSSFLLRPASRELSSCGTVAGEDEDEPLVADVVSVLRQQRSRSRWGFLKSLYAPSGFSAAQAARITFRLRSNPRLALRFFHWSEAASLCRHDLASYATLVHVLARARLRSAGQSLVRSAILHASDAGAGDNNGAMEVFAALTRTYRACDSTPLVFDLLVRACLRAGRVDEALEIVRMLRNRGFSPSVGTCNELVRTVSKGKGAEAGFDIYAEIFGTSGGDGRFLPNVQTFNALLLSFHREGGSANAERIRREMDKFACKPNCFTYSILMADLCEEGRVQEAKSLWEEMAAKGIKPDVTAYNTLIDGFCRAGETARAEELFREMVTKGMEPTSTSYDRLVGGYCSTGDVDTALLLFEEMLTKDFRPEFSTVGELIGEFSKKGRVEEGLSVLRGDMRRGGFFPSREMFISLIKAFCRGGQMEEGLKLQAEMARKGFEPNSEVYSAFIEAYEEQGDVDKAGRLKDEMLKLGLHEGLKQTDVDDELS